MINLGFEFEFVSDLERKDIRELFTEFTGEKITGQYWVNQTSGKHWVLTEDPSCVLKREYEAGYELISPVFPIEQVWDVLTTVFDFIDFIEADTKLSTGIHVNIDVGNDTSDLDPVEMVLLFEELEILGRYNRLHNKYCVPYINKISQRISKYKKHYTYTEIKKRLYDSVTKSGKYQTINFSNLKSRGYVEFRALGGENYHHRKDDIWKDVMHCVDCVIDSTYRTSKSQRKVINKLNKILKVKI